MVKVEGAAPFAEPELSSTVHFHPQILPRTLFGCASRLVESATTLGEPVGIPVYYFSEAFERSWLTSDSSSAIRS
jgi:hypothetical protein